MISKRIACHGGKQMQVRDNLFMNSIYGSTFEPNVRYTQTNYLVRTKTINPIGNKLGEGCDVLFVLSNIEYVERKLVARLHHHLAGLCASSYHTNFYLLAQRH